MLPTPPAKTPLTAVTDVLTPTLSPYTPVSQHPATTHAAQNPQHHTRTINPAFLSVNAPSPGTIKSFSSFLLSHSLILTALEFYMEIREKYAWENTLLRRYFDGMESVGRELIAPEEEETEEETEHDSEQHTETSSTTTHDTASTTHASISQYGPKYVHDQIALRDEMISQLNYQMELLKSELGKLQNEVILQHSNSAPTGPTPNPSQTTTPSYTPHQIQSKLLQNQHATLTDQDLLLLNHLIKNYLDERNYTMSQVTFADEAEFGSRNIQDLMGALNGTAPPQQSSSKSAKSTSTASLSQQFTLQDILLNWKAEKSTESVQQQNRKWHKKLDKKDEEITRLQQALLESENECLRAEERNVRLEEKCAGMFQKIQLLEEQVKEMSREPVTSPVSPVEGNGEAEMDDAGGVAGGAGTDSDTTLNTKNLAQQYSHAVKMMDALSQNIPTLMLGTKTKYKALLVPFILSVFENSSSASVRSTMINTLLDMNKKPTTKEQRQSIIGNMELLATKLDEAHFAKEVLGVVGERLETDTDLHETQLLMFCEMIGVLGDVMSRESVDRDLFPLLVRVYVRCGGSRLGGGETSGEATDDSTANSTPPNPSPSTSSSPHLIVRKQLCSTLATLLPHLDAQRYNKIESILIESLENDIVSAAAQEHLVTPFVDWCQSQNLMFTQFLPSFLRHLKRYLMGYQTRILSMVLRTYKAALVHVGDYLQNVVPEEHMRAVVEVMGVGEESGRGVGGAIVDTNAGATAASAHTDTATTDAPSILSDEYDQQATNQSLAQKSHLKRLANYKSLNDSSPHTQNIQFILNQLIPQMLAILCELDSTVEGLVRENYAYFGELSERSGPVLKHAISTRFLQIIHREYAIPHFKSTASKHMRHNILAAYLCGPLAFDSSDKEHFGNFIQSTLLDIVYQRNSWRRKDLTLLIFALKSACKLSKLQKRVLNVVWSFIVHEDASVRVAVCELFMGIMSVLDEDTIDARVLPCFITLGNDSSPEVRIYALDGLAEVVKQLGGVVKDLDKISMSFDQFFENPTTAKRALQVLTNIIPQSDKSFREGYILQKLFHVAKENNSNEEEMEREHMVNLLLSAYKALNGVTLTKSNLRDWIIPGLEMIEKSATKMHDKMTHAEISRMLRDLRQLVPKESGGGGGVKSPGGKLFGKKVGGGKK